MINLNRLRKELAKAAARPAPKWDGMAYDNQNRLVTPKEVTKRSRKTMAGIDRMSRRKRRRWHEVDHE